ncbi:MAG: helix-turn-helix domain-containing protein [Chloroflexi bacterium]|nr:helix-turn-helix domain-containing protein [Chloroflexota bacterium]
MSISVQLCLISSKWLIYILVQGGQQVAEESARSRDVERIFLTFQEAQEFLGVSHQTLYKLMKEGLPSHKIGKKRVFLKEELIQWIKEH